MLFRPNIWLLSMMMTALLLSSCGKDSRCGKSTGEMVTVVRDLTAFDKLNIYDKIQIELKPSTVNRATITCGENLLNYIVIENSGNELTIRDDNNCNFLRSYKKEIKVVLEYTHLNKIYTVAAGTVSSKDTIKQSYFEVIGEGCSGDFNLLLKTDSCRFILHTGNSNLNLKGQSTISYFYSGGTSIIDAGNLACIQCFSNNSGSGDFTLNAISYLFAQIEDQGSVYYYGNPLVDKAGKGKGTVAHQ